MTHKNKIKLKRAMEKHNAKIRAFHNKNKQKILDKVGKKRANRTDELRKVAERKNHKQGIKTNIKLTIHATKRLIERTGLTVEEFKKLYEQGKVLQISRDLRSKKVIHELLYSHKMNQLFIVIRNTEKVITVYPEHEGHSLF